MRLFIPLLFIVLAVVILSGADLPEGIKHFESSPIEGGLQLISPGSGPWPRPGTAFVFDTPVYGTWDNDAVPMSTELFLKYAEADFSVTHHNALVTIEYKGLVDSVRVYNPDWIPLFYVWLYGVNSAWSVNGRGSFFGDLWWAAVDNDFFARTLPPNSDQIWSAAGLWPGVAMLNPYAPGLADTLGAIYAYHLGKQDLNKPYVGYFCDWVAIPHSTGAWSWVASSFDSLDMDQNGIKYSDEVENEEQFQIDFVRSLPQAFRDAADNPTLLVIINGSAHQNAEAAEFLDGGMNERTNYNTSSTFPFGNAEWKRAIEWGYSLPSNALVDPPLVVFQSDSDILEYAQEAQSTIARGVFTFGNSDAELVPPPRKFDIGPMVGEPIWWGNIVSSEHYKDGVTTWVRCMQDNFVWPYLIETSEGDTLSRGGGWPQLKLPTTDCTNELGNSHEWNGDVWRNTHPYWTSIYGYADPWGGNTASLNTLTSIAIPGVAEIYRDTLTANTDDVTVSVRMKNYNMPTNGKSQIKLVDRTASDEIIYGEITWTATPITDSIYPNTTHGATDLGGGWYNFWFHVDLSANGIVGHDFSYFITHNVNTAGEGYGIYMVGAQVEYGITSPCGEYLQTPWR